MGYGQTDGPMDGRTDGQTDQRTDGPTDGRTYIPSYRDAWTLEFEQLLKIDNGYFSGGESCYPSVNGDSGDFLCVLPSY